MRAPAVEARSGCRRIAVYIDGLRLASDSAPMSLLNSLVPINHVLAIEAYPDVLFAPVQWRTTVTSAGTRSRARW